jgi:hypothetical protein
MAKKRFDGVIEAVRYSPDGQLALARLYERRGPTFSDRVLLNREQLVQRLRAGKKFVGGERQPYLASTFTTGPAVHLNTSRGLEVITTLDQSEGDNLQGIPIF